LIEVISIAVDVMSGDLGSEIAIESCLRYAINKPSVELLLVGRLQVVEACISKFQSDFPRPSNIRVVHAEEIVGMADKPSKVLRQKQSSSMAVALNLVKDGVADACVSAGNTGALMLLSRSILRMLPGIDRPAISKELTTPEGKCLFLDLGANVDSSAEHLYQFAVMGAIYAETVGGVSFPRVALLNVGEEDIKGNEQVKLASRLLSESAFVNYAGYIEGHRIFRCEVDVVVCDGFVGNVALKCGEGVVELIFAMMKRAFDKSFFGRVLGWLLIRYMRPVFDAVNPARHNGASFLGLQGVVVKSHGDADVPAFGCALEQACREVRNRVPEKINKKLDEWMV
jgi:glycerol-3-phosphate acyltransferase PlsX